MNFNFTEEQLAVRDAARDFAQKELLPGVIERDEKQQFPAEQIKQLGELGFMGMMVDPKYGGSGMDTVSYVLAMEEISKVDASTSVCMSVNNSLVCWGLEKYGTEEQKEKYLPKLASGECLAAHARTEHNKLILKIPEKPLSAALHKYGLVKNQYIIVRGSIGGARKRAVNMTPASRESKKIKNHSLVLGRVIQ